MIKTLSFQNIAVIEFVDSNTADFVVSSNHIFNKMPLRVTRWQRDGLKRSGVEYNSDCKPRKKVKVKHDAKKVIQYDHIIQQAAQKNTVC